MGIGRHYEASFGTRVEVDGFRLGGLGTRSDVVWPSAYGERGGFRLGGGGMTRVREIGDGASPRFLAEPRNDTIVGVCAGIAGMRDSAGGGLASAFEEATSV